MGVQLWQSREGAFPDTSRESQRYGDISISPDVVCVCVDQNVAEDSPLLTSLFRALLPDVAEPDIYFVREEPSQPITTGVDTWRLYIGYTPSDTGDVNRIVLIPNWEQFAQQSEIKRDVWRQICDSTRQATF